MKTTRKLLWLAVLLVVSACQPQPASPARLAVQAPPGAPRAVEVPAAVPTILPAEDLSVNYAAFPGLYWTGEQLVSGNEESVRVLSVRPCAELLNQLSAGEWRAAERLEAPAAPIQWPSLLLLERGDALALARAVSLHPVTATVTTELSPLALGEQCRAQVTQLHAVPVEAAGAEGAQGEAVIYPFLGGCRTITAGTVSALDVMLMYDGPGDFRAVLAMELPAPVALGEQALNPQGLTLTVFRSEQRYFDILAEGYAQMLAGLEMQPEAMANARAFSAASETPGTLTVMGIDPLEGEVDLTHLADDAGLTQTFRAGIRCIA